MCVVYLTVHTSAYIDVMSQLMGFAPGDIKITNRKLSEARDRGCAGPIYLPVWEGMVTGH